MWLWLLFGLGLMAVLVWVLLASARRGVPGGGREESPEQILKRRYARGEIEPEEYRRRLEELRA